MAREARGAAQTYFAGDIVLALPRLFPDECRATEGAVREPPYVLVCLRGNPDTFGRFAMPEPRLRELAGALDALAARGLRIAFLPFQQHETEDDDTLHREVAARMRHRDAVVFVPWTADIGRIATLFRGASLAVAMRLHAAVLAEAFGAATAIAGLRSQAARVRAAARPAGDRSHRSRSSRHLPRPARSTPWTAAGRAGARRRRTIG